MLLSWKEINLLQFTMNSKIVNIKIILTLSIKYTDTKLIIHVIQYGIVKVELFYIQFHQLPFAMIKFRMANFQNS